jgi:hypothetical protein
MRGMNRRSFLSALLSALPAIIAIPTLCNQPVATASTKKQLPEGWKSLNEIRAEADLQWIDDVSFSRDQIAEIFCVPEHLLPSESALSNLRAAREEERNYFKRLG